MTDTGMPDHDLSVGVASVEYEVAPGTPMAGFIARESGARGTHDPVSVRVLVIDRSHAVIAVDACALHESTCMLIQQDAMHLGLADAVVSATHTHSGPSVACGRVGVHDPTTHAAILTAANRAIREAIAHTRACRMEFIEQRGLDIAYDRRRGRPVDIPVHALRFVDRADDVVALWVNFACHPVVLNAANLLISADYPGYVRRALEDRHPGSMCLFTTGAAGEVNSGHHAADSLTPSRDPRRTFERAEQIGRTLADAVTRPGRSVAVRGVAFESEHVTLEYEQDDRTASDPEYWTGRISILALGRVRIVFLPGEPFNEWADSLLESVPHSLGFVTGYTDGVPGYLPSRLAYDHGGYEVESAHLYYGAPGPFTAECSLILASAVERALGRIAGSNPPRNVTAS